MLIALNASALVAEISIKQNGDALNISMQTGFYMYIKQWHPIQHPMSPTIMK